MTTAEAVSLHAPPTEPVHLGKALRRGVPRSSHADWSPPTDRADPVELLTAQNTDRLPWLVPVRHGRMAVSPFTFYRGAAAIMAADLASTPTTGLMTQICGDAHLSNFGTFASPEREQVFDVNDFDETLPGPWEWDVKRLATSFVLAGRDNSFPEKAIRKVTTESVAAYRRAMRDFGAARTLEMWYSHLTMPQIIASLPNKRDRVRAEKIAAKAERKDSLRALDKLTEEVHGQVRFKANPPLLVPLRHLPEMEQGLRENVDQALDRYRETLGDTRRRLLDRFHPVDIALKVVGVGSVGTWCLVLLLIGKNRGDPLLLQVKQATRSVLEDHLPDSVYAHPGQRVVEGQRLMQVAGDIFLGWSEGQRGRQFYIRQLHDMKGSAEISRMNPTRMARYASLCGWTLAHAHARAGDAVAISGYLGNGDKFDRALTEFAHLYADQNRRDFDAFTEAIASGRIPAADD